MIVVDTQLLVYLTTRGAYAGLARAVAEKDATWSSSVLWRSEFRSVVAGEIRRGNLTVEQAIESFEEARAFLRSEYQPLTADILALIQISRCSAYDLEFVAVAQALNVRLVTNDKQVLADFPTLAISPQAFAA